MHIDLKADSGDSDNNIFIFIIGIRATSRIELFFKTVPALLLRQRKVYDMTLWIIYLTSTHPKLSKNVYVLKKNGKQECVYRSRVRHFVAS